MKERRASTRAGLILQRDGAVRALSTAMSELTEARVHLAAAEARAASQGLTLATLCDMVLGEEAEDRSDDALVKGVGLLLRKDKNE